MPRLLKAALLSGSSYINGNETYRYKPMGIRASNVLCRNQRWVNSAFLVTMNQFQLWDLESPRTQADLRLYHVFPPLSHVGQKARVTSIL